MSRTDINIISPLQPIETTHVRRSSMQFAAVTVHLLVTRRSLKTNEDCQRSTEHSLPVGPLGSAVTTTRRVGERIINPTALTHR